jgi:hypothetical protein
MQTYWQQQLKPLFAASGLGSFDKLWQLRTDWFEAPNVRRGGWSGVVKYTLEADSGPVTMFIKRQENHISRTWLHPFKGIPTFQKEYNNILRLIRHDIPTLDLVYFGVDDQRAILVTRALEGYSSLEELDIATLSRAEKNALIMKMAAIVRDMHRHHYQHNCLYPKHIFVRKEGPEWDVRIIDLEKMKRTPLVSQARDRDLSTLYRHARDDWPLKDRLRFFRDYMGENRLSAGSKAIWRRLTRKIRSKRHSSR